MKSLGLVAPATFDHTNCMYCAFAKRDPLILSDFFLNWPTQATNESMLLTPLCGLVMMISQAPVESLPFYVEVECVFPFMIFLVSDTKYVSFYAVRALNVLLRGRCSSVLMKLQEEYAPEMGIDSLVERLIFVIRHKCTLEKREALLCFASIFQYIVDEDTLDEDMYVESVYHFESFISLLEADK